MVENSRQVAGSGFCLLRGKRMQSQRQHANTTAERYAREQRLRRAVLLDALRCIAVADAQREKSFERRQALVWVRSRDFSFPFSFENVCDSLGLDPCKVRQQVLTRFAVPVTGSLRIANLVREHRGNGNGHSPARNGSR